MGGPSQMLRAWALSYGALWAFTIGSAVLVLLVPGARVLARESLRLSLSAPHNPPPGVGEVVSIAANNILRGVWPLTLGLIDAQRRRVTRALADATVLANLLVCGLLVGGAVGGYGVRALAFLPHVPLEWAGVAAGAAGWAVERGGRLSACQRTSALTLAIVALACAACMESWLTPHR